MRSRAGFPSPTVGEPGALDEGRPCIAAKGLERLNGVHTCSTACRETPLSSMQTSIWLTEVVNPGTVANHLAHAIHLLGRIDTAVFRLALQRVVDHHALMRATIRAVDGRPMQVLHDALPVRLEVVDGSAWTDDELDAYLSEAAYRPFDLERGPLARFHLVQRGAEDQIFLHVFHHIVTDMWSLVLFTDEYTSCYQRMVARRADAWKPARAEFEDVVRLEEELRASDRWPELQEFWRGELDGARPTRRVDGTRWHRLSGLRPPTL
jgi:Condensation domain